MPRSNLALIKTEPRSEARAALAAALAHEADLTRQINDTQAAFGRCRAIIASAPATRTELSQLEAAHQSEVENWAASGAQGPAPRRDDAKFESARQSVQEAEANLEAAQTGAQSLQLKLETLFEALRHAREATSGLVLAISLEEAERLLAEQAEVEKRRAALRADIMGLVRVLAPAALRGDLRAVRAGNSLGVQLEALPPEPTEAQCRAARDAWGAFADRLRNDPEAHFREE